MKGVPKTNIMSTNFKCPKSACQIHTVLTAHSTHRHTYTTLHYAYRLLETRKNLRYKQRCVKYTFTQISKQQNARSHSERLVNE